MPVIALASLYARMMRKGVATSKSGTSTKCAPGIQALIAIEIRHITDRFTARLVRSFESNSVTSMVPALRSCPQIISTDLVTT